jgi:hypothetical protein
MLWREERHSSFNVGCFKGYSIPVLFTAENFQTVGILPRKKVVDVDDCVDTSTFHVMLHPSAMHTSALQPEGHEQCSWRPRKATDYKIFKKNLSLPEQAVPDKTSASCLRLQMIIAGFQY